LWRTCWLLAWFTSFRHIVQSSGTAGFYSYSSMQGFYFAGTNLSRLFAAGAASLFAVIVWKVSTGPVGARG
jgi:hypothetical protein